MISRNLTRSSLAIALVCFAAAARADEAVPGDLSALQGSWTTKAGPKKDIPVTLTIAGDAVTVEIASPLGLAIHAEGKLKVDATASPKRIDWVGFTFGEGQEMPEVLGLYELDGDAFRLVNGGPNNARPTEFKKGDGVLAEVLTFARKPSPQVAQAGPKASR